VKNVTYVQPTTMEVLALNFCSLLRAILSAADMEHKLRAPQP